MEEPASGTTAQVISIIVRLVTLLATVSNVLESVPNVVDKTGERPYVVLNFVFNSIFTIEACVRVAAYVPFRQVLLDGFIWLDILTVVPFLVRLVIIGIDGIPILDTTNMSQGQRVLEAFGSIRLLKLCRYDEGAALLMRALSRSLAQLYVPMFMLLILVASCSTVLYNIENDVRPSRASSSALASLLTNRSSRAWQAVVDECVRHWQSEGVRLEFLQMRPEGVQWDCSVCLNATGSAAGAESEQLCATCRGYPLGHPECLGVRFAQTFTSIPHSMWFVLVTVTTVGFGDVYPSTWYGQLFIAFVMLLGVVFLAMPLSTVGNNFHTVWEERQLFKLQALVRQMLAENGMSTTECKTAFREFDADNNGLVDAAEFRHFVRQNLGLQLRKPELSALWKMIDVDGTGAINFVEFANVIFPTVELTEEEMDDDPGRQESRHAHKPSWAVAHEGADQPSRTASRTGSPLAAAAEAEGRPALHAPLSLESFKRSPSQPLPTSKHAVLSHEIRTMGVALASRADETDAKLTRMERMVAEMHARLLEGARDGVGHKHRHRRSIDRTSATSAPPPTEGAAVSAVTSATTSAVATSDARVHSSAASVGGVASCATASADGADANGMAAASQSASAPAPPKEGLSMKDVGELVVSGFGRDPSQKLDA